MNGSEDKERHGKPETPIVLAHGIAPFDAAYRPLLNAGLRKILVAFGQPPDTFDYFKGIASHLRHHGYTVYAPRVSFATDVQQRAAILKDRICGILASAETDKVHIIAHSMGGLDARHMIVKGDMANRVATLTTIGTPHLGTSLADIGLKEMGGLIDLLAKFKIDIKGFRNLSTEKTKVFNQQALDAEAQNPVHYITYTADQDYDQIFTPLKISWKIINSVEGSNDGLVSLRSAAWTPQLGAKVVHQESFPIPADHLNQIGWWDIDELHSIDGWPHQVWKQIGLFEKTIKSAYLKMARDAERMVA